MLVPLCPHREGLAMARNDPSATDSTGPQSKGRTFQNGRSRPSARNAGELPVYRLGTRWERVSLSDLRKWLKDHRHVGGGHDNRTT